MTYIAARVLVGCFIYLICCVIMVLILRDGQDIWNGKPRSPWLVAVLASLPWWFGVPALLALLGIWGPM